jgi:arginine-tRNA-protein transferase
VNQRVQIPLRHFFATPPSPCPYIPGHSERKVVTLLGGEDPEGLHNALSQAGFRRSQDLAYRPACDGCNACVSVRMPVTGFRPERWMRRIMARNTDLTARQLPAVADTEHYHLFRSYLAERHFDGGMADMGFPDYRAMIEDSPVPTHVIEFRDPEDTLVAVCLTDRMSDGYSLVYSFFDPEASERSLGNYMILWHAEKARDRGLRHIYLGYWIANSRKMAYKARFRPLEALVGSQWRPFESINEFDAASSNEAG